ncbi:Endoribonuclease e-like protein [Thalictrum thalictroides]|uniref:Endoribonuclease e-like protein n=1 Tax=Thalictrum thalictroides TaxID=46969 RepID=A0A7J6VP05_THATH|nr:Endoribonuclease e-like protein [Thalictrum thalictroides]
MNVGHGLIEKMIQIDNEMERHAELLKEIEQNPTDINATYDSLEDCDAVTRLSARCLSAVCAYDNTIDNAETLDFAQAKFDDILNSPSLDVADQKSWIPR